MDPASWSENNILDFSEEQKNNRKLIKDIMEHAIDINIPLEVDGGFGEDWYSCK